MNQDDFDAQKTLEGWQAVSQSLIEGGIPQVLLGPAGKAISRLIAEATEIPAAWLQQKKQAIRDETSSRTAISKAVTAKAAKKAASQPDIVSRTIDRALGERVRKQTNRESVAKRTFEQLSENPPNPANEPPDDDWMNLFSAHAEQASSDRLQDMWARVLAGQIRRPGAFSYRTMQFVSTLDTKVAAALERFAPLISDDSMIVFPERFNFTERFPEIKLLEEYGLFSSNIVSRYDLTENEETYLTYNNTAMVTAVAVRTTRYDLPYIPLTSVGIEITSILHPKTGLEDIRPVGQALLDTGIFKDITLHTFENKPNGTQLEAEIEKMGVAASN